MKTNCPVRIVALDVVALDMLGVCRGPQVTSAGSVLQTIKR